MQHWLQVTRSKWALNAPLKNSSVKRPLKPFVVQSHTHTQKHLVLFVSWPVKSPNQPCGCDSLAVCRHSRNKAAFNGTCGFSCKTLHSAVPLLHYVVLTQEAADERGHETAKKKNTKKTRSHSGITERTPQPACLAVAPNKFSGEYISPGGTLNRSGVLAPSAGGNAAAFNDTNGAAQPLLSWEKCCGKNPHLNVSLRHSPSLRGRKEVTLSGTNLDWLRTPRRFLNSGNLLVTNL